MFLWFGAVCRIAPELGLVGGYATAPEAVTWASKKIGWCVGGHGQRSDLGVCWVGMESRSDEALMVAYRRGDKQAFAELFRRMTPMVRGIMRRAGLAEAEVEELVQHCFLQLHRARMDYQEGRPLRPWLAAIAMNVRRDYLRYRSRRPEGWKFEGEAPEQVSEGKQEAAVEAERLRGAMRQLPDNQREVLELHWFEGLSFAEVAEVMGAGVSAVKVRAHRAYKKLRGLLESGHGKV